MHAVFPEKIWRLFRRRLCAWAPCKGGIEPPFDYEADRALADLGSRFLNYPDVAWKKAQPYSEEHRARCGRTARTV